MKIDSKEITEALRVFYSPGDVFEVRALDAVTQTGRGYTGRPHVESGYFDYDHIGDVPVALDAIRSAKGVYVTLNPVHPELLARCANRMRQAGSGDTTTDNNVRERRWLLVDCDVQHNVSGISASDEEHENAKNAVRRIRDKLAMADWPDPVMLDTGNGASLLYRIDLLVSEETDSQVAAVLDALQDFTTEAISIDVSVKNRARIFRLPGTMNCKGDDIPERPHRMARLMYVPEDGVCTVMDDQWARVVRYGEGKRAKPSSSGFEYTVDGGSFDIDAWMRERCPEAEPPVVSGGQRKWFMPCPWTHEHSGANGKKDTYVGQMGSGAVYFKCSHAHCANRKWEDLRDLKEPGWRDRKTEGYDVDIGFLTGEKSTHAAPQSAPLDDVPPEERIEDNEYVKYPEGLYDVHGFIRDVMNLTLKYAPSPNRPLALAGALALMSFLCARKVKTESGLRPNIYLLALAKSGSGKEMPRDVNHRVLEEIGLDNCLVENVASGEGLEDKLMMHNALIWQCDEFYSLIKAMTNDKNDVKQSLMKYLLVLYTSAHKNFITREKAGKPGSTIPKPYLTLFATTTPDGFFGSINELFLNDGMFARLNIIVADEPSRAKMMPEAELTDGIVKFARMWRDFVPPESGNMDVNAMTVPFTASARELACDMFENEQYDLKKSVQEEWKAAAWNRYFELSMRYALLYACSEAPSPEKAVITAEAIEWAKKFVKWEIQNKIHITQRKFYKTEFEKQTESVVDFMRRWHRAHGTEPMPAWKFNREAKALKDKKSIVESLVSQKRLMHEVTPALGHGRPRDVYWLPEFQAGAGA